MSDAARPRPQRPLKAASLLALLVLALTGCGSGGTTSSARSGITAPTAGVVPVGHTVSAPEPTPANAPSRAQSSPPVSPHAGKLAPIDLQVAAPRQGESVAGSDLLVYGASEPPADVTVNGLLATREGIGFRVSLHFGAPGRHLLHVVASLPGFATVGGWVAVCMGGHGAPQSVPQGLGALRHAPPVQESRRQALRVRCSA